MLSFIFPLFSVNFSLFIALIFTKACSVLKYCRCLLDAQSKLNRELKSWHLLIKRRLKKSLKAVRSKNILYWLILDTRHNIGSSEFRKIKWILTKEKVKERNATNVFKYWSAITLYLLTNFLPLLRISVTVGHRCYQKYH